MLGKITIIKSLLVSQIIFNAQMISMPAKIAKRVNSVLFSFLWNSKKDKIKRKVVCMTYELGGLKMVYLDSLLKSFLLKWILHYFSSVNTKWKYIIDGFFDKIGGFQNILSCNCKKVDMTKYLKSLKIPPYYKEIIYAWIDLKELIDSKADMNYQSCDIKNEDLWFNSNVKGYDGKVLFFKKWFDAGITQIKDIVVNTDYISLREVQALFQQKHASLFLEYHIVTNAIPKIWKRRNFGSFYALKNVNKKTLLDVVLTNINSKRKSKMFYSMISKHLTYKLKIKDKWECILMNNMNFDWKSIWIFNLRTIKENKIIEFNYKMLHDLIPHKYNLHKWKLCNDPICSFDDEVHDSIHLFVKCKQTRLFWCKFNKIVQKIYGFDFYFNETILIKGYDLKNKKLFDLNSLINYAKYAIYVSLKQKIEQTYLMM